MPADFEDQFTLILKDRETKTETNCLTIEIIIFFYENT